MKKFLVVCGLIVAMCNFTFAANEDFSFGPGLIDMQIAGAPGTNFPNAVASNGLMITPNFDQLNRCSLNVSQGTTVHYNFPTVNFNFLNDPSKDAFVTEQFNFLLNYNMKDVLTTNYKNNIYINEQFFGGNSKRKNWTMDKVGLKNFDGSIIELEFSSPDYKNDGMVNVKATYDIANNTLTLH